MNQKNFAVRAIAVLLVAACVAAVLALRASAQQESWQIVRADYGWRQQRTDVTDLLRDLLGRGGVNGRVAVNNQTMGGDPAVGKDRYSTYSPAIIAEKSASLTSLKAALSMPRRSKTRPPESGITRAKTTGIATAMIASTAPTTTEAGSLCRFSTRSTECSAAQ